MTTTQRLGCAAFLMVLLGGCATQQPNPPPPAVQTASVQYGQVRSVDLVRSEEQTLPKGAIVGGVLGGVLGHQVGSGHGKDAATVVGIVGGALIGNEIDKKQRGTPDVHRVAIRFDNGTQRSFDYEQAVDLRVGDRVRVEGERVSRY
jgi:outer membrane lipoprotein SlyB